MDGNQQTMQAVRLVEMKLDLLRPNKRLLFCVPESAGDVFLSTSLLGSLECNYPEFDLYFACKPQYKDMLKGNKYVHKTIDYNPVMEHAMLMEGFGNWEGLFSVAIMATALTQRHINYHHNGVDVIGFDIHARP